MLMLLLGVGGLWLRWSGRLYDQRLFLRFAVAMGPAGIVAILAGWMTTEIGRQPWVVYNVMRTAQAVSNHSPMALSVSLGIFVVVYVAVFGTGISYLLRLAALGPDRYRGTTTPGNAAQANLRPARPLSAAPVIDPHTAGSGN
jgi:cytochrome d ubiquinol oxidase subunit I